MPSSESMSFLCPKLLVRRLWNGVVVLGRRGVPKKSMLSSSGSELSGCGLKLPNFLQWNLELPTLLPIHLMGIRAIATTSVRSQSDWDLAIPYFAM
ncbi:hypothetical protein HPB50_004465 [Hyalomma asiaticum]|uniref:Uncharacterized protein n=1 Tax=Hyalomma asiaticum TaxID=266040 RepID=A0ACB7TF44_HYAAI|nr:hypothetical protein HPB50_004465 [Hyalomma asiaticum]